MGLIEPASSGVRYEFIAVLIHKDPSGDGATMMPGDDFNRLNHIDELRMVYVAIDPCRLIRDALRGTTHRSVKHHSHPFLHLV